MKVLWKRGHDSYKRQMTSEYYYEIILTFHTPVMVSEVPGAPGPHFENICSR